MYGSVVCCKHSNPLLWCMIKRLPKLQNKHSLVRDLTDHSAYFTKMKKFSVLSSFDEDVSTPCAPMSIPLLQSPHAFRNISVHV